MKKLIILLSLISITALYAQQETSYQNYAQAKENERAKLWQEKDYAKALSIMNDGVKDFFTRDNFTQKNYRYILRGLYYNIACAHSLLNSKDSAIVYLNKSIEEGYADFLNANKDTDFDNIRTDSRYAAAIEKLRDKGDYPYILNKAAQYKAQGTEIPAFTYQSPDDKALVDLKTKYELEKVAGNGDEISRIINLMKWVHKVVKHDGNSTNPKDRSGDAIIEICKKENRGVNCRMMATILNEVYLSMGFKSRFITCMPKGEIFDDCHVINEVYSTTLKKWLWMDPTFETFVTDDKGNYLSIRETRERLIKGLPVSASEGINWNGQKYGGGGDTYLHSYMTKNLYRFSIPLNSCSGFENLTGTKRIYVELYPVEYNPKKVELGKITGGTYYTTDDNKYWAAPLN